MIVARTEVQPTGAHAVAAERALIGEQLSRLARTRVFFAHQSVGMNLLEGVRLMGAACPELPFPLVVDRGDAWHGGVTHAFVPENGDPDRKLAAFRRELDSGIGAIADVAILKLCYSDFGAATDPIALFATYQRTMTAIRHDYPHLTLAHVTVPLTTVAAGGSAAVMRLLGRPLPGIVENSVREEFNQLVRHANAGTSMVFDLARLESTTPTGERDVRPWNGRLVPRLHAGYTDDGGHLNAAGRMRFGRAFVAFLASTGKSA